MIGFMAGIVAPHVAPSSLGGPEEIGGFFSLVGGFWDLGLGIGLAASLGWSSQVKPSDVINHDWLRRSGVSGDGQRFSLGPAVMRCQADYPHVQAGVAWVGDDVGQVDSRVIHWLGDARTPF